MRFFPLKIKTFTNCCYIARSLPYSLNFKVFSLTATPYSTLLPCSQSWSLLSIFTMSFHVGVPRNRRQSIQKIVSQGSHPSKFSSSPHLTAQPSSTSSPLRHHSNLNHNSFHHSMPMSPQHVAPVGSFHHSSIQIVRGRRGRQARPSQLTPGMHRAVRRFCRAVGAPNVVPPAGFRDFRGWLIRLSSRECRPIWDQLLAAIARDVSSNVEAMHALKEDVVREIVKCVVIPRPDESAKLVSTNAGRQASRPRSGTTLMVVLEQQIARVEHRLPQLVAELYPPMSPVYEDRRETSHISSPNILSGQMFGQRQPSSGWSNRTRSSLASSQRHGNKLPSVHDLLAAQGPNPRASLPSFKELDASLRRSRSSAAGGRWETLPIVQNVYDVGRNITMLLNPIITVVRTMYTSLTAAWKSQNLYGDDKNRTWPRFSRLQCLILKFRYWKALL